jgi:twinkle protein
MLGYFDKPASRPRGLSTHVAALDEIFKWMPGYTNLFTGWPGSGKSEFVRHLLLLDAVQLEKKSILFAPEDMPEDAWYDALIHSLTGQTPDSEIPGHLPRRYYVRAMEWAREHFFLVQPKRYGGKTPRHILDIFEAARAKHGTTHHVLDPWNKADHSGMNAAGGWQPYLVAELGAMTDWSVETGSCLTLIAHPAKKPRPRGEAREVPDSDGVSGGQTWDDMMHTICAVYRPNVHAVRNDPAVAIYSHKLKSHRRIGAKPGSIGEGSETPDVLVNFDWKSARYTFNGVIPLDTPLASSLYADAVAVVPAPVHRPLSGLRTHQDFQNEFATP